MPFVIVRHGSGPALYQTQAVRVVECRNLAFLVNGQNNGVRRRIDAEPDKRRATWGRDVPLRNPNVAV